MMTSDSLDRSYGLSKIRRRPNLYRSNSAICRQRWLSKIRSTLPGISSTGGEQGLYHLCTTVIPISYHQTQICVRCLLRSQHLQVDSLRCLHCPRFSICSLACHDHFKRSCLAKNTGQHTWRFWLG